jgi:pimeloyl-ACP methyl ester carboxylesterase
MTAPRSTSRTPARTARPHRARWLARALRVWIASAAAALVAAVIAVGVWNYWVEATAPRLDPATTALHFVEIGSGPKKMVLIHGLAGSARYWIGRVDALRADHTLLVPDLLGFGLSPKPRARYDLDDHLAPLERLISARGFDTGQTVLVGHSLGAVVTLGMANRHPAWFDGVVLIAIPVFRDRADAAARLGGRSLLFRGMLEENRLLRAGHYIRTLYGVAWLAPWFGLPQDVYLDSMRHTWNSLSGTLEATILGPDYGVLMAGTRGLPILFIHGENDTVAPIEAARALAAQGSPVRFVAVPDADHQLLLKDPARVWSVVREFERELVRQ